jgi:hypothetical protein
MIRDMIAADHLPDYHMAEEPGDIIRFTLREGVIDRIPPPLLSPETLDEARALLPGADVHALVAEWQRVWQATGSPRLRAPARAFLGWVAKRATD